MSFNEVLIALLLISFGIFCDGGYSHKLMFGIGKHITYFMESPVPALICPSSKKERLGADRGFSIVWKCWEKI